MTYIATFLANFSAILPVELESQV
ncbi:hypothetical protein BN77_2407 [Rhizobium mesoamericanum STM3625]|uniref:Uncharacterized protein n=1 Tax=Rhizobium mesoamericanum STM3625 TaxID=1211777 RepID=K0PZ23_9HYPH|nr:hypothetical protein BN77_2407 [Rhizobium mesoamericanum STM3625]